MNRDDVARILAKRQKELHQVYAVKSLSLFGSVARNEARPESDVDLLVEFTRPVGLFEFIGLQQYLEGLLGCPVDLGTKASLKPSLKEQVLQEMIHVA
jgi:predicted nucleotidyltransferase